MQEMTAIMLGACWLTATALAAAEPAELPKQQRKANIFEAESAERISGAVKLRDATASGKCLVALSSPGQGIQFSRVPASSKLAIHNATTNVGTISVTINGQPQQRAWEVTGLAPGKHTIAIINRGPGPVAVDALVVR
jgi:hypothetical protein